MKNTPLFNAIMQYNKQSKARFHMPSHNGIGEGVLSCAEYDVTELNGLDNLLNANDVIMQAQQLMSQAYKCKYSMFLTQGGTVAMQIALRICKHYGDRVIAYGDMHTSFWASCVLCNLQIIKVNTQQNLSNILQENMRKTQDISAIFVTSPDYFGNNKDIVQLRKLCNEYNLKLIVDQAHGAHYAFSELLPLCSSSIADMTMVSMHKTMSVYGGGALLNINNSNLIDSAIYYRTMLHSTSPSYLIMASMDYSREEWLLNGNKWYSEIKSKIDNLDGCWGQYIRQSNDDFSRLVLVAEGKDAKWTYDQLFEKGIALEMAYQDKLVAIITPNNVASLQLLSQELCKLNPPQLDKINLQYQPLFSGKVHGRLQFVNKENSIGKVCAGQIGIYPPGIPLISVGDLIDEKAIKIIKDYGDCVFGLVNGRVPVLE